MQEQKCPYCETYLKKTPQRKTKCPFCDKHIFVKNTPTHRTKRLMTEIEAEEADAQWSEYHEKERIIRLLQTIGATEKDLEKEQKSFFKKRPIHKAYLALLIKTANNNNDYHCRKMAHYQLAIELSRKKEDFLHHLKEAARYELLRYKQSGATKVEILPAGERNSCSECQKLSGKILDIETALTTMPIPCIHCTHTDPGGKSGFCRCTYVVSF